MTSLAQGQVSTEVRDPRFRTQLGPWPTAETRLGFDRAHDLYRKARRFELSRTRLSVLAPDIYRQARMAWLSACDEYRLEIEEQAA